MAHDAHFAIVYFYPLGERPQMVAAVAAAIAHALRAPRTNGRSARRPIRLRRASLLFSGVASCKQLCLAAGTEALKKMMEEDAKAAGGPRHGGGQAAPREA